MRELSLYLHIPFCARKCRYCDFLSWPAAEREQREYLELLLLEIEKQSFFYKDYDVASVFVGGGTPSLLAADAINILFEKLNHDFAIKKDCEITVEANPDSLTTEKLTAFSRAGVNRLSIGLQSTDDEELRRIGRLHDYQTFCRAYENARQTGFQNINIDLMASLPGQTFDSYRKTLERVLQLRPEHISAYSLILEEGTLFFDRYRAGELKVPDEETDRAMYQETKRILYKQGYHRYEISNYARRGYECRHNCGYWRRRNYLGLGIGAASLVENVRFRNGRELAPYLKDPLGCHEEVHALNRQEQMEEFMFLGLRMTEGLDGKEFERLFGCRMEEVFGEAIEKNIRDGLLQMRRPLGGIALTDKGLDLSNYVMAQFLLEIP